MSAEQILVIILSSTLTVFLILGIVVLFLIIVLLQSLKRVVRKAEAATENVSEVARSMAKRAVPAVVSTMVAAGVKQWRKKGGRDGKER